MPALELRDPIPTVFLCEIKRLVRTREQQPRRIVAILHYPCTTDHARVGQAFPA
jgi:hypothetical protein